MNRIFTLMLAASLTACIFAPAAAAQEEMSFRDALKAAKEARKAMKANPEEAKKYQQATINQAKQQFEMNKSDVNVAGMYDSQAQQGTLGDEWRAGEAAARKAAKLRFTTTPAEALYPKGDGFTVTGPRQRRVPKYNEVEYALPERQFQAGTKTIIDWSKGICPMGKWCFKRREIGSSFHQAPTVSKWQGKSALGLKVAEYEPDLGSEYLPENFSLEFDVWSTPSTSTLPQDYSDNFLTVSVWGDVNEKIFNLSFSPNTIGPHGIIDNWTMSFSNVQTNTFTGTEWEFPKDLIKPNSWTHIAISFNDRDISVYVNGHCMACFNRAFLFGEPRIFWLHTEYFRNKPTYIANFKVCGY